MPFAAIESQLLGQPTTSQYGESCDFAMLFMSDDHSSPTPINKTTFPDHPLDNPKNPDNESEPQQTDQGPTFTGSEKFDSSPNKKRKGFIFEPPKAVKKGKEPMKVQPVASQPEKGPEEPPKKVSKHIHKWTYSRVNSSTTEIQQDQIRVPPVHTAKADPRSNPKGLVSASSAPAVTRPKTRNRGRRRGRGMLPISSAMFASTNADLQVSNTMPASRKAEYAQRSASRYGYPILSSEFLTVSSLC